LFDLYQVEYCLQRPPLQQRSSYRTELPAIASDSVLTAFSSYQTGDTPMTVPASNHPCWQRLASGGIARLKTQHLGTQLMTKRIERSTDSLAVKASELHAYFAKWERALPAEVSQLASF
jgi:hypothetical protein